MLAEILYLDFTRLLVVNSITNFDDDIWIGCAQRSHSGHLTLCIDKRASGCKVLCRYEIDTSPIVCTFLGQVLQVRLPQSSEGKLFLDLGTLLEHSLPPGLRNLLLFGALCSGRFGCCTILFIAVLVGTLSWLHFDGSFDRGT